MNVRKFAIAAFTGIALSSLALPALARCGGVGGYCGYRYHVPTEKERIEDLGAQLTEKHEQNKSLQFWLMVSLAANVFAVCLIAVEGAFIISRRKP